MVLYNSERFYLWR